MDFINNLKTTIEEIDWTEDNVTKAISIVIAVVIAILMLIKNSPVRNFADSVAREIRLIEWLKFKDVVRYTVLVVILCTIAVAIMTPLDSVLVELKKTYILN